MSKMDNLVKIGELSGDNRDTGKTIAETLANSGFVIVNAQDEGYSTYLYYICKNDTRWKWYFMEIEKELIQNYASILHSKRETV